MVIGICDDEKSARSEVRRLCELYFTQNEVEHTYIEFESGEDVIAYCLQANQEQIDLLFLDVEMKELDGIRLMERLLKHNVIWRIVFVTGHKDKIFDAFSQKTIGFILKPPTYERVSKKLDIVRKEKQENIEMIFSGCGGEQYHIRLEEIVYLKAAGSYTEIHMYSSEGESTECVVVSKKIGELECSMNSYPMLRVHKSFLVNLANVVSIGDMVTLKNVEAKITIGRKYKEQTKAAYAAYISDKVRKRI